MKLINIFSILAAITLFSSCSDDETTSNTRSNQGTAKHSFTMYVGSTNGAKEVPTTNLTSVDRYFGKIDGKGVLALATSYYTGMTFTLDNGTFTASNQSNNKVSSFYKFEGESFYLSNEKDPTWYYMGFGDENKITFVDCYWYVVSGDKKIVKEVSGVKELTIDDVLKDNEYITDLKDMTSPTDSIMCCTIYTVYQ